MKHFKFVADTIDGVIQRCPQPFNLECSQVTPIGVDIIRNYDGNECINAINVFLVYYSGQVLGSTYFKTLDQFLQYQTANCRASTSDCLLTVNGCFVTINGCFVTIKRPNI